MIYDSRISFSLNTHFLTNAAMNYIRIRIWYYFFFFFHRKARWLLVLSMIFNEDAKISTAGARSPFGFTHLNACQMEEGICPPWCEDI